MTTDRATPDSRPDPHRPEAEDGELDRLRQSLYAPGATAETAARYRAAIASSTGPATEEPADARRTQRASVRGAMLALPLVAAALLAGLGAVGSTMLPGRAAPAPSPTALVPPHETGTRVWTARGVGSLPSSPVLEGAEAPVVVAIACRGRGSIHVIVDQQDRRVACAAGRIVQDSEYFTGHHGRFTVALSTSAPVRWVLTVTALDRG